MNWFKDARQFIHKGIFLEKSTGIGKLNLFWAKITFMIWIISILSGLTIEYFPSLGSLNPLNGFTIILGGTDFNIMTILLFLNLPFCIAMLIFCRKQGWINKKYELE